MNSSMKKDTVKWLPFSSMRVLFGIPVHTISYQVAVLLEIFVAEMATKSLISIISAFRPLCGLTVNQVCAHHSFLLGVKWVNSTLQVSDWVLLSLTILELARFPLPWKHYTYYNWSKWADLTENRVTSPFMYRSQWLPCGVMKSTLTSQICCPHQPSVLLHIPTIRVSHFS